MREKKLLFNINLQLFNGMFSDIDSESLFSEPTPEPTQEDIPENIDTPPEGGEGENEYTNDVPLEGGEPPEQDEEVDIKSLFDNVLNGINSIPDQIKQQMEQNQQQEQQQENNEPTPEELEAENEAFYENLVNNGKVTIQEMIQQEAKKIAQQEIQTMQQQQQKQIETQQYWQNQAREFAETHEDAKNYFPKMQEILMNNPHLQQDKNPYEVAYKMAKYEDLESAKTPQSLEDMLGNEENIQKVLSNPKIKQAFLESLKTNNAPTTVSASSGVVSVTPENTPKSIKEASSRFAQRLNQLP